MEVVNNEWIMNGLEIDDEKRIKTVDELEDYINKIGFIPLFSNSIPGFSVEEKTASAHWWCGDLNLDPWEWRTEISRRGNIAYGKFFGKKVGFISKEWIPYFANYRRDGYDFDALFDDEKASLRMKKIMDCIDHDIEIYSNELKNMAGFAKGGEKNYEGTLTDLQMHTYLCVRDFKKKLNKKGEPYGWAIAIYSTMEHIFGKDFVTKAYSENPAESFEKIMKHVINMYPNVEENNIRKEFGIGADAKKIKK